MRKVKLEDVCEILDSQRKPITGKDRKKGAYPYYGANGVLDYVESYIFDDELVLLAEDGGHFDEPSRGVAYRVSGKCWVNNHAHVLKPKGNIDVDYLGFVLKHFDVRPYVSGAVVKKLNQSAIRKFEIPLPSMSEQKRIVKILEQASELIEKRREAIKLLDEYLRSVFLDMFGDPISNPKKLEMKSIDHMGDVLTGNTPPRKITSYYGDYIEWIKSDNLNNDNYYLTKAVECLSREGAEKGRIVPSGSILVTCIAGSLDCIGNAGIADREVSFNQQINAIVPDVGLVTTEFLFAQILHGKELFREASTNSMKGMLNKSNFSKIQLLVPPLEEQRAFSKIFKKIEENKDKMQKQLSLLNDNFQALLSTL